MSRRLTLTVCAVLQLMAVGRASSSAICDPGASPAPDIPFESESPGALLPTERQRLFSLDGGRYEPRDGRVADRRESRLLTNAQAARLLCPPRDARAETSPSRLTEPKALTLPHAVGGLEFDGAVPRPPGADAPVASNGSGMPPLAAGTDDPNLLRDVLSRVRLREDSDPRAASALQRALRDILRTPTGREVAEDFVAERASAEVRFEALDGTLISINGRRVVSGMLGQARSDEGRHVVALNRLYLDADPEIASREMAATLAHELFGHVLEHRRATQADFPLDVLNRYRGDEANGRLIGWLVQTELGAPLSDRGMWAYLKSPERYHQRLALIAPYYAQTFSAAEMANPLPSLRARLADVRDDRSLDDDAIALRKWRIVIEHLVAGHGMERRRFSSVSEDIENFLEHERALQNKASDEVEEAIQRRIDSLDSPQGREPLRRLSRSSRSEYLGSFESRLARYRTRLDMETRGRQLEPLTPPPPDQIGYKELEKLYQDDLRDNPRHWGL